MTQRDALAAIIRAATHALRLADTGELSASPEMYALGHAFFDLTGNDELYELAGEIATEANLPHEPSWRKRGEAFWQTTRVANMISAGAARCAEANRRDAA